MTDKAFLDCKGFRKPRGSVSSCITDGKAKNLPRIITQRLELKQRLVLLASSPRLLTCDRHSPSLYLQNGVLLGVSLPVNLFLNTDHGKLWALSFYSHRLGGVSWVIEQTQASTDSPAPKPGSRGS